jgi:rhomboid family GlyGly-CTERM serine protease
MEALTIDSESTQPPTKSSLRRLFEKAHAAHRLPGDTLVLLIIVLIFNAHLIGLGSGISSIFIPSAVKHGQWWRLLTHPFVHVTWYHLLLDAGAFFILYADLKNKSLPLKMFCLIACAGTSLAAALIFSPLIESLGLCGLSGTAHGLMALTGLEMIKDGKNKRIGQVSFMVVLIKSIYELISGTVVFDFMHMGLCGTPVAACHFGGVVGGILSFLVMTLIDRRKE